MWRFLLFSYFAFSSFGFSQVAEITLPVSHKLEDLSLTSKSGYFQDPSSSLSFEEIKQQPFNKIEGSGIHILGVGAFWIEYLFINPTDHAFRATLVGAASYSDAIELYNSEERIAYAGDRSREFFSNFAETIYRTPSIDFEIPPGNHIYYLKLQTRAPPNLNFNLWDTASFHSSLLGKENIFLGILFGFVAIMIGYNLFLAVRLRRVEFYYYVGYIACFLGVQFIFTGLAYHVLPKNSFTVWFIHQGLILTAEGTAIFGVLFAIHFLELKKRSPRIINAFKVFFVISSMNITYSMFDFNLSASLLVLLTNSYVTALLAYVAIRGCIEKYRPAYFYIVAWGCLIVGSSVTMGRIYGLLPDTTFTQWSQFLGGAIEVVLLSLAIGDKVRLEQEESSAKISSLNSKLQENMLELEEKERARTLFFQNTSHELRTPLNGIISYLDLVLKGRYGDINDKVYLQLTKTYQLVEGLKSLVNLILDSAKAGRGELKLNFQDLSLASIVREADNLGEALKLESSGMSYYSSMQCEDDRFVGDRAYILTIICNLLGNAFKFKDPQRDNKVSFHLECVNETLNIVVSDSGIGIEKASIDSIFEQFKQLESNASRSYEGTGLGLSMVKDLVDLMEGEIKVESVVGKGSTFSVCIPAHSVSNLKSLTEDSVDQKQLEADLSLIERNVKDISIPVFDAFWTIMIIDDNASNCEVFEDILSIDGYTIRHAQSGEEGLELMRKAPPHLLLLDMMMPKMSGEEVISLMKADATLKMIPIIVVTARASEEDRIYGLSLGADDYLPKPIVSNELRLKVKSYIERQKLTQEIMEEKSKRESLEGEVEATTSQLIQAEKMVLLGQLVAGVAHDIAAPAQLVGNANFQAKNALDEITNRFYSLLGESDDPESQEVRELFSASFSLLEKSISDIELGGRRIAEIQEAIRNQSRLDASKDEFSLLELMKESTIILSSKLKQWKVELDVDPDHRLSARRSQIGQVLSNLLSNSADALEENRKNIVVNPHIIVSSRIEDSFLVISIEDAGQGIKDSDKVKVFEAFFTTKSVGYGTGLGLSICSKIIHAHGGRIELERSEKLGGARFVIHLPRQNTEKIAI